ncbi:MAG: HAMP domain-containing sensor histidine kinase [Pseudomonadota bacterium]
MSVAPNLIAKIAGFVSPQHAPRNNDENAIMREQQRQMAAMGPIAAFVSTVNGTAVFLILLQAASGWAPWLWYGSVLATAAMLLRNWVIQNRKAMPEKVSGRFLRRTEYIVVVIGLLWGSAAFMVREGDTMSAFFITLVQIGMASGFAALTAPIPRISLRFATACIGLTVVWNITVGDDVALATAALTIVLIGALALGGYQSKRQLVDLVRTTGMAKAARQDLVDAIESLNDAFALKNAGGEVVLSNARFAEWFPDGDPADQRDEEPFQVADGRWVMRSVRPTAKGGLVSIHADVSSLKRRERELVAARREAELADEAKTRFLSTMSHELRTPLNIILGFSKLMTPDSKIQLGKEEIEDYADQIQQSGQHLLTIIDDIIDYSKVGLDKYLLEREPTPVRETVARAVDIAVASVGGAAAEQVEVQVSPRLDAIMVDETATQRILSNLLSNALKFSVDGSDVVVKATVEADERVIISVRDFGIGIPEEAVDKVFDAFYQIDSDANRKFGGTGLGLTLSRRLARLHGGDVTLSSRPGVGTCATLSLPPDVYIQPAGVNAGDKRASAA